MAKNSEKNILSIRYLLCCQNQFISHRKINGQMDTERKNAIQKRIVRKMNANSGFSQLEGSSRKYKTKNTNAHRLRNIFCFRESFFLSITR